MSIDLHTQASERVNGRCSDCGQFSGNSVHFHGPKAKFRGRPKAHLFYDGGGMVTRCDDPTSARELLMREYAWGVMGIRLRDLGEEDRADVEELFPEGRGQVQRGRINVAKDYEVSWWWMRLDDDAKGPGVTTAVVWQP